MYPFFFTPTFVRCVILASFRGESLGGTQQKLCDEVCLLLCIALYDFEFLAEPKWTLPIGFATDWKVFRPWTIEGRLRHEVQILQEYDEKIPLINLSFHCKRTGRFFKVTTERSLTKPDSDIARSELFFVLLQRCCGIGGVLS